MPLEIKEIVIKAVVENKVKETTSPTKEEISVSNVNLDLLLQEIIRKQKNTSER